MVDVKKFSDGELKSLIENHRRNGAFDKPLYAAAVEEWHQRNGGGLDIDKSLSYLRQAASERRLVSYGELAEANGATWDKVRYPMNHHLWALVCLSRAKGWPMLSAMIVNKSNVATGHMEPETLAGFTKAAEELGHQVDDPAEFLKAQQSACFEWGASG